MAARFTRLVSRLELSTRATAPDARSRLRNGHVPVRGRVGAAVWRLDVPARRAATL